MDRAIIMICNTLWVARMRYAMRIRYGPRECDMRYANTLWAARMRSAICEYAMDRANAIYDTRIVYAL